MSDPRVLVTTYPSAFLYRGGGEVELIDLLGNLRQLGVKADIYGSASAPLVKYDMVLHYSVVPSGLEFAREAKRAGKRLVLMPSLWWVEPPNADSLAIVAEFFRLADSVVFKSRSEHDNVSRYLPVDERKIAFCRWGVDAAFEEPADSFIFKDAYKLEQYILWTGIIEERKNQLTAIHALKDLAVPLVFIGDYRERSYYEACVRASPSTFRFIPHMQAKSEMLRSAIQNCKVYLELSLEPPGFSAFEAALAKVPMVISASPWAEEHFADTVVQVDPKSPVAIREAVSRALIAQGSTAAYQRAHNRHLLPHSLEPLVRVLQQRS